MRPFIEEVRSLAESLRMVRGAPEPSQAIDFLRRILLEAEARRARTIDHRSSAKFIEEVVG